MQNKINKRLRLHRQQKLDLDRKVVELQSAFKTWNKVEELRHQAETSKLKRLLQQKPVPGELVGKLSELNHEIDRIDITLKIAKTKQAINNNPPQVREMWRLLTQRLETEKQLKKQRLQLVQKALENART